MDQGWLHRFVEHQPIICLVRYVAPLQNEKLMYEIAQENKRLSEPLSKALKEVETLRASLASYEKDKQSLTQTKVGL